MNKLEIKYQKISDLKPYENNPRINDEAVKYVANSIKEFGFKVPIIVDKDNVIIAGHTRLLASIDLGLDEVPTILADDLSDEQVRAFRLADNKVSEKSEWDFNLLDEELSKLDLDMEDFGFIKTIDEITEDFDRKDLSDKDFEKYEIIIKCNDEFDLQEKYEKLTEEGYECTISTL